MLVSAQVFVYLCVYIKTTINKKIKQIIKKTKQKKETKSVLCKSFAYLEKNDMHS